MRETQDNLKRLENHAVEIHVFKYAAYNSIHKLVLNRTVANYSPELYEQTKSKDVAVIFVKFCSNDRVMRVFTDKYNRLQTKWVSIVPKIFEVENEIKRPDNLIKPLPVRPSLQYVCGIDENKPVRVEPKSSGISGCVVTT